MEKDKPPVFDLDINSPTKFVNVLKFHERIIEFIGKNIKGIIDSELLCYLKDDTIEELIEAKLPRNAYKQSLKKSLVYFSLI